jgi:plastocyanin
MNKPILYMLASLTAVFCGDFSYAADDYIITLKDHQFSPQELTIPAGQKVKLIVKNTDNVPAEFESGELNREKVVGANSEITVYVGPLVAGRYNYADDFRRETTKGTIIAK